MEYVVTMTTQVPEGTSSDAVDEMRTREADRAAQLAAVGFLLRLWRPPLQPGEWRSLGLFAAPDASALDAVLSSMPLRVWRTDTVLELEAHPNDPGATSDDPGPAAASAEFMTKFRLRVPEETAAGVVQEVEDQEAERYRQLDHDGRLVRLWRVMPSPTGADALGLWRARDTDDMQTILESLPMIGWREV